MGTRVKFLSLKEPLKYGYVYDTDAYDFSGSFCFHQHFRMCETYGDVHENGSYTQHSGDWPVQVEHIADFLASLASYILTHSGEEIEALVSYVSSDAMRRPHRKEIEFAASVIFKPKSAEEPWEKTRRYYSVEERKISTVSAKRYDTRYKEVQQWNDGSADAIYRMLIPSYANAMDFFSYATAIREWCQEDIAAKDRPYFYGHVAQFLKWFDGDAHRARELYYAYNALTAIVESFQARHQAEMHLNDLHWPPNREVQENGYTADQNRENADAA